MKYQQRDNMYRDQDRQDYGRGRPERRESNNNASLLDYKMLRDLPLASSSIQVKADPYDEGKGTEGPYRFYNKNNRILNPKYGGEENLDGSSAMQMYDEPNSSFLNYFDIISAKIEPNYRMMALGGRTNSLNADVTNYGVITDMFKAFCEQMAKVDATTYTEIAAFKYVVATDIKVSANLATDNAWSPYVEIVGGNTYFTGFAAAFLSLIYYQTILQRLLTTFSTVNKERAYRKHLKTMGFARENVWLEKLWSRFNSKSWLANWLALAVNIEGEFIDAEWMETLNTLGMLLSRKSNAIIDPLMSIICLPKVNFSLTIYAYLDEDNKLGPIIFSSSNMDADLDYTIPYGTGNITHPGATLTFAQATAMLTTIMDPTTTCSWARISLTKSGGLLANVNAATHQQYSNTVINLLTAIDSMVGYFKTSMSGLRKIIEIANRVGLNRWTHIRLGILKSTDTEVAYNTTVADFLSSIMTGSAQLVANPKTARWEGYTLFNKYYGIAEYDYKSGGLFLTTSTKDIIPSSTLNALRLPYFMDFPANAVGSDDYDFLSAGVVAVNRYGEHVVMEFVNAVNVSANPITHRLAPIAQMASEQIRFPRNARPMSYSLNNQYGIGSVSTASAFYELLENVFHIGLVDVTYGTTTYQDVVLSSDILCLTDFQVIDQTNVMIAYARSKGPVVTNTQPVPVGFDIR